MQHRVTPPFFAVQALCDFTHFRLPFLRGLRNRRRVRRLGMGCAITCLLMTLVVNMAYAANGDLKAIQRLLQAGRTDEALQQVNAYLSKRPNDAQAMFHKGLILVQMNQTDQAIDVFDVLTRDYPELPEPYNNLAVLYSSQGKFDKARDILLTAVNAHPTYTTAHENLGDLYVNLAGMAYGRALQLDRNNASVQTKLAMINDLSAPGPKSRPMSTLPAVDTASLVQTPTSVTQAVTVVLPHSDETKLVLATVHDWADAWSSKDVNRYLSFYTSDFVPSSNLSRATWEAARRRRISKPRTISIGVNEPQVELIDSTQARVTFLQTYSSNLFRDQVRKMLQLHKQGNHWRIHTERVIAKVK